MAYSKKDWVTGDTITASDLNRLEDGVNSCQSMFTYKGNCLFSELPTSGNNVNDTYYVTDKECGYTWNGTAWSQSGAYGISIDGLKSDLVDSSILTEIDFESAKTGYVKNNYYSIVESTTYSHTEPFRVTKGSLIEVTCTGYINDSFPGVAIISQYNRETELYNCLVNSSSANEETYRYVANEDIYVVISYLNSANKKGSVIKSISNIENEIEELKNFNYEIEELDRRILKTEKNNDFEWSKFDKPYFVFVHDDTNEYLETYYNVFNSLNAPMSAATIPSYVNETHLNTLRTMVENGGEVLVHYIPSLTESSKDEEWLKITRDGKRQLESYGFDIHGIIKAGWTEAQTKKGEKYCRRYFDYADNMLGKSKQYNLPRKLMLNYSDLNSFKNQLDSDMLVNGIHAYGFHGGRDDEAWITESAMAEIINYIKSNENCVITTYKYLYDNFGSSVLAEKIKALESN